MPLILGVDVPTDGLVYNDMFLLLEQKIIQQHQLIAKAEGIGKEPDLKKLEKYLFALNYCYLLYTLKNQFGTLQYWKDRLGYDELRACFLTANIDLDNLLNTIT